jgi:hypothetical protein
MPAKWRIALETPLPGGRKLQPDDFSFPSDPVPGDTLVLDLAGEDQQQPYLVTRRWLDAGKVALLFVEPYVEGKNPSAGPIHDLIDAVRK